MAIYNLYNMCQMVYRISSGNVLFCPNKFTWPSKFSHVLSKLPKLQAYDKKYCDRIILYHSIYVLCGEGGGGGYMAHHHINSPMKFYYVYYMPMLLYYMPMLQDLEKIRDGVSLQYKVMYKSDMVDQSLFQFRVHNKILKESQYTLCIFSTLTMYNFWAASCYEI